MSSWQEWPWSHCPICPKVPLSNAGLCVREGGRSRTDVSCTPIPRPRPIPLLVSPACRKRFADETGGQAPSSRPRPAGTPLKMLFSTCRGWQPCPGIVYTPAADSELRTLAGSLARGLVGVRGNLFETGKGVHEKGSLPAQQGGRIYEIIGCVQQDLSCAEGL